jgi:predicted O-methyltransferase YrrM
MKFTYQKRKWAAFLVAFLFSCCALNAEWNPEIDLMDEHGISLDVLRDQKFITLKNQVSDYLKNSWCTKEKSDLIMDLIALARPSVCVEIGAFTGSSVLPIAATLKYLNHGRVYAIDAWSNEIAVRNLSDDDPNKSWWSKVDMKVVQDCFQDMLKKWALHSICTVIKSPSELAASKIGQIDFLHLDGDYSEEGSMRDVEVYLPKVRSGGYILLSNLFIMINGKQPKMNSFCALFDECEMICEIEHDNVILFRKR